MNPQSLLKLYGLNGCSDPRDRAFALLPLAADGNDFEINYNVTTSDLFLRLFDEESVEFGQFLLEVLQLQHCHEHESLYPAMLRRCPVIFTCFDSADLPAGGSPMEGFVNPAEHHLRDCKYELYHEMGWSVLSRVVRRSRVSTWREVVEVWRRASDLTVNILGCWKPPIWNFEARSLTLLQDIARDKSPSATAHDVVTGQSRLPLYVHRFNIDQPWGVRGKERLIHLTVGVLAPLRYSAACTGLVEAVSMFLDWGADVNARGGTYGNALQAASTGGYGKVVQMLIDRGTDVHAQGGEYSNALCAALGHGRGRVVEILLDRGADFNVQEGTYGNTLQAALAGGHKDLVDMLERARMLIR